MPYREPRIDRPRRVAVHPSTWVALGLGITALVCAIGGFLAVFASGLFAPADVTSLVPVFASVLVAIAAWSHTLTARKRSRAPFRHGVGFGLAGAAILLGVASGWLFYESHAHPYHWTPSPDAGGPPHLWSC